MISTSSSDDKLDRLRETGADHVLNYRSTPAWGAAVRKITGDRGVDHVIEVGGSGTLQQSMTASRVGGRIAMIGVLTGTGGDVPIRLALARQLRMGALLVGSRRHQLDMIDAIESTGTSPWPTS